MQVALGVSVTPMRLRAVLVNGENADGVVLDHDIVDPSVTGGIAAVSPADSVVAAVLRARADAASADHRLVATGVVCSDHVEAATLWDALVAQRIDDDVMLVSEIQAAIALAQAVGRALDYGTTALMCIERDTAALVVVDTAEAPLVSALTRSLHSANAMAVLTEMASSLDELDPRPDALFLVGSGVDVKEVACHLQYMVPVPVRAPGSPELAVARGAALAAANAPTVASTVGAAYLDAPEGSTAPDVDFAFGLRGNQLIAAGLAGPAVGAADLGASDAMAHPSEAYEERKPFRLASSAAAAALVFGAMALVTSLGVVIHQTTPERPSLAAHAVHPNALAPPVVQIPQRTGPPPAAQPVPAPRASPPPPQPQVGPSPKPLQQVPPALAAQELSPPAPMPLGTPPGLPPAPIMRPPVPGLPPVLLMHRPQYGGPPAVAPRWYPAPPRAQWPPAPQYPPQWGPPRGPDRPDYGDSERPGPRGSYGRHGSRWFWPGD